MQVQEPGPISEALEVVEIKLDPTSDDASLPDF